MKFKKFVIIIYLLHAIPGFCQDLVVTHEGDSLHCKITKVKDNLIHFTIRYNEESKSITVPLNQVKSFKFGNSDQRTDTIRKAVKLKNYPQYLLALNGGWSYRTAASNSYIFSNYKYMSDLRPGYRYGLDFTYFVSEQFGIGFKYYVFRSKNQMIDYVTPPEGQTQYGIISDNISLTLLGPAVRTRILNKKKQNGFMIGLAIGYVGYKDVLVRINDYRMEGGTLGMSWDLGYDLTLWKNIGMGFQFSYIIGSLSKIKWYDSISTETMKLENENKESLNHIDLSVGLRINL